MCAANDMDGSQLTSSRTEGARVLENCNQHVCGRRTSKLNKQIAGSGQTGGGMGLRNITAGNPSCLGLAPNRGVTQESTANFDEDAAFALCVSGIPIP
jgi:hypothetical protein